MATKQQQERVAKFVTRWKPRLALSDWTIHIEYRDKDLEMDESRTLAQMITNLQYTEARMIIFPALFRESVHAQEATVVHELIHIITQPQRDLMLKGWKKGAYSERMAVSINEEITEKITKMLFRAYKPTKTPRYNL